MRQAHIVAAGVAAETEIPDLDASTAVEAALQTLSNGVLGYRTLSGEVADTVLTSIFNEQANHRSDTIEATLRAAGDAGIDFEPKTDGSVAGAIHRAWLKIESVLVDDGSIVESVLRAENYAMNQIEEALNGDLTDELRKALVGAQSVVASAIEQLEGWLAQGS